jgi:purine nucleoside permease
MALAALAAGWSMGAQASPRPTEVRVVIVTTWESTRAGEDFGELHAWLTRWPLNQQLTFPVGVRPLAYDPDRHVLAVLTGMATARAAASIMALGTDPRFDLSHAYWIVAGTAGVDPKIGSVGSAAWARWVVDGDLGQELDAREIPSNWPTGILPYGRTTPYGLPAPAGHTADGNVAYRLNPGLVDWAYRLTAKIELADDATLTQLRAAYAGPGHEPPKVLKGEGLMSARTWYGERMNDWAERWVSYWTGGQGTFAMSAEEDTGVMQAMTFLGKDHRVRLDRVLILRAASDYTVQPAGVAAADFLAAEVKAGFPAEPEALDALYRVAEPVAKALADDWAHTRDSTPGAAAPPP